MVMTLNYGDDTEAEQLTAGTTEKILAEIGSRLEWSEASSFVFVVARSKR